MQVNITDPGRSGKTNFLEKKARKLRTLPNLAAQGKKRSECGWGCCAPRLGP